MLRLTAPRMQRQSVAFFSETMFRPKQVVKLDPSNVVAALSSLPQGSKLLRRWPDRLLITGPGGVLGVMEPLACLPLPVGGGVGGMLCEEYVKLLHEPGPGALVLLLHREGMCCTILNKQGEPIVGPEEFITRERGRFANRNMQAAGQSLIYEDFFKFLQTHSNEVHACKTLWKVVTGQSDSLWTILVNQSAKYTELGALDMSDSRWVNGNGRVLPRKEDDVVGVFSKQLMPDGEMEFTLSPERLVARCKHGRLLLE